MAEQFIDEFLGQDFSTNNFQNTRDPLTGHYHPPDGASPSLLSEIRRDWHLTRLLAPLAGGRIYHDSTDADAECSITPMSLLYRGSIVSIAGATNVALSGGDVAHYIYADPESAAFVVSTTGWPSTPHVRLAVITLSSGVWRPSDLVEHRPGQVYRVTGEPLSQKYDMEAFTSNDTITAAENGKILTNEGASGEVILTLPTPAPGLHFRAIVMAAQYLRLKADTGHVIRHSSTATSSSGGYIRSNVLGAACHLIGVSSTQWNQVYPDDSNWTVDA